MEYKIALAIIVYLIATFILSALWIRFSENKRSGLSRLLRRNYLLFPLLPLLLIVFLGYRYLIAPIGSAPSRMRKLFEKLSGKKSITKQSNGYGYGNRK